jgi:transposase
MGGDRAHAVRSGMEAGQRRAARRTRRRDITDAIRYLVKEGIQWRPMPADFLADRL